MVPRVRIFALSFRGRPPGGTRNLGTRTSKVFEKPMFIDSGFAAAQRPGMTEVLSDFKLRHYRQYRRVAPVVETRNAAKRGGGGAMLTRQFLFGINLLTLAGFLVMGVGLTLTRQGVIRAPLAFALMTLGTALVVVGLYLAPPAT